MGLSAGGNNDDAGSENTLNLSLRTMNRDGRYSSTGKHTRSHSRSELKLLQPKIRLSRNAPNYRITETLVIP